MNKTLQSAGIISTGIFLPDGKETAADFVRKGVPPELLEKIGVYEHRACGGDEEVIHMETKAALRALDRAGLTPPQLDLILSSSTLPINCIPPNSNLLQAALGAFNAAAFDVSLACCGIIPQLMTAANFIALGQYKYVLISDSTDWSRIVHPRDLPNLAILGDGAAALIVGPVNPPGGFLAFDLQTEGKYFDRVGVRVRDGEDRITADRYYETREGRIFFHIDKEVDEFSCEWNDYLLNAVPRSFHRAVRKAGLRPQDIDALVLHQNIDRLVNNWIKECGVSRKRVVTTHHKYGNLAAATIGVNLHELIGQGGLAPGKIVALSSLGAGFSAGTAIIRWS